MVYIAHYNSILGEILLASENNYLIGLWIKGQKYFLENVNDEIKENENEEILIKTKNWLNRYFNGEQPEIKELKLAPIGSEFRQKVWKILCKIPYGQTTTYGEIGKEIAKQEGKNSMSAQAIGGAVSHNPISIIIPCHRVIGKNGNLTGYAGGIDKKMKLLELEKADIKIFNKNRSIL